VAAAPHPSLRVSAGAEAALLLARWEAAAVGSCGDDCVVIGDGTANEAHLGAIARGRALFVWRGSSAGSDDHVGLGVEARVAAAGDHASGIPLSHGAILVVFAYGQL
jgi:hypothetical protein